MKRIILAVFMMAALLTATFGQSKPQQSSPASGQTADAAVKEANAAIDRWSAAYSANDVEAVAKNYWPDAILLGTKSPVISTGSDAIKKYFTDLKLQGSGNKNSIQERNSIPIDDHAVLVTGFYEFTRMQEGKPVPGPSRFTMLVTKRGNQWRIAHHHSSPHVLPQ
jgi:uncharacterized protein (TIGR02246 family)